MGGVLCSGINGVFCPGTPEYFRRNIYLTTRWKMKQDKLSPRYSTRMQEIITIHAK
ncbi:DUF4113 domain-containing protein [Dyadobacter arcticus]|uniref:DUF4113 domain-containing protein n=1 Tax=Dyadobacter arcticus TaxID=1078754 RepID=UPI001ABAA6EC